MFEMMNEPCDGITDAQVDGMNQRELDIIRNSDGNNPTRWVVIRPNDWNGLYSLSGMTISKAGAVQDPYLIANFHDYTPWSFGSQAQGTWGSLSDLATMTSELQLVKDWSAAHGDNPVIVNVYGAVRSINKGGETIRNDLQSRLLWYRFLSANARAHGFSHFARDDSGSFGIYNRAERSFEAGLFCAVFGAERGPSALFAVSLSVLRIPAQFDPGRHGHRSRFFPIIFVCRFFFFPQVALE
jgi:hypothetical protein